MSVVANIAVNVDSTKAVSQLQAVDRAANGLSGSTGKLQQAFGELNTALAGIGVGLALAKVVGDVKELDTNMRRLGTVGGNVKELDGALGQLSTTIGGTKNKTELATAAYQAASAGFSKTTDTVKVLEAATKASVGGLADMEGVTSVLVKTLNAYGLSANDAYKVTDSISKAVEIGNQEWSDYVSQLGRVASIASLAGVNLDEVNAFIASATKNGATAEIAFTGLGASLNTLLQPTKESQEAAKELGIEWNLGGLQAKGFTGLMKELGAKMSTNKEAAARLLGSQEAMRGAFAAASKGGMDYVNALAAVQNAAGKTDEDFQKMKGSLENQLKALDTAFKNLSEVLGKALMPILIPAVQALTAMINAFASLPAPIQTVVVGIGLVATAIIAIGTAAAVLAPVIAGFKTFAAFIGAANIGGIIAGWLPVIVSGLASVVGAVKAAGALILAVFSGPVGWTVLAVAAVVAMAIAFRKPLGDFANWLWNWGKPIREFWVGLWNGVVTNATKSFEVLRSAMVKVADFVKGIWTGMINSAKSVIRGLLQMIANSINAVGAQVNRLIGAFNRLPGPDIPFVPKLSVPAFAKGGVVSGPTLALVGEAGPEYIIPADKMAAASTNYLNGARGNDVIPAFADGGYVGYQDRPLSSRMVRQGNDQSIDGLRSNAARASYLQNLPDKTEINIQTGPVMEMNGERYVSMEDFERGLRQVAGSVYKGLRTPAGRYATGVR